MLAIVSCGACSPTRQIAHSASEVSQAAARIARQAEFIGGISIQPDVVDAAGDIRDEADLITDHSQRITIGVASVEDKVPAWMTMIQWIAIAASGAAIVWIITATGIGSAIRVAVGWLPRKKVNQAELALDTLDASRPEDGRELIAALRSDRTFDAAFIRAKARRKAGA